MKRRPATKKIAKKPAATTAAKRPPKKAAAKKIPSPRASARTTGQPPVPPEGIGWAPFRYPPA
jgi:hypothetical protein